MCDSGVGVVTSLLLFSAILMAGWGTTLPLIPLSEFPEPAQSRHLMGWVENKSIWFFLPAFTDELEGGESTESLESFSEIVSSDEIVEVS